MLPKKPSSCLPGINRYERLESTGDPTFFPNDRELQLPIPHAKEKSFPANGKYEFLTHLRIDSLFALAYQ